MKRFLSVVVFLILLSGSCFGLPLGEQFPSWVIASSSSSVAPMLDDPDGDGVPGASEIWMQSQNPPKVRALARNLSAPMPSGPASGKKVLFYTRLNTPWINFTTELRQMLTDSGYTVDVHAIDAPLPDLTNYDVLAIVNTLGDPYDYIPYNDRPLSWYERDAIREFVGSAGKGFFYTGDYLSAHLGKFNDVSSVFSVNMTDMWLDYRIYVENGYIEYVDVPYHYSGIFDFRSYYPTPYQPIYRRVGWGGYSCFHTPDHAIFKDVDSVLLMGSSYTDPRAFGAAALTTHPIMSRPRDWATNTPYPVVSAIEHGNGRVAIACDSNAFANDGFAYSQTASTDNRQFALNIFNWLARVEEAGSVEVTSVTTVPSHLWLDEAGAGTGIVFKAFTSAPTSPASVSFKVIDPNNVEHSLGESAIGPSGNDSIATCSWWGSGPGTIAGEYRVVASIGASSSETTFIVTIVPGSSTGMGQWMTAHKDPRAIIPPNPLPITCPARPWEALIGEKPGYFNSLTISDPVGIPFGNFIFYETDLTLKSRFPLVFARIYNSLESRIGPFGRGWSTPFTSHLEFVADDVVFVNSDDSKILFVKSGDNYQAPEWTELRLSYASATGYWSVSHPNGAEWTFNEEGKIIRMSRACCGMGATDALLFDYDGSHRLVRVTNPAGSFLEFSYSADNLVVSVVDSTGRAIAFTYENGNMTSFTGPLGDTTQYSFSSENLLTSITRPGNRVTAVTYAGHRVTSVTTPVGAVSTFDWDLENHRVVLTDPTGTNHEYSFSPNWRFVSYSVPSMSVSKQFVSSGSALVEMTDSLGNTFHYSYGAGGLVETITDAMSHTTTYAWDPITHKLTGKVDSLNLEWRYIWCPRGNLWMEIDPAGEVTSYTYDTHNNRTGKTDRLGRVTRWVYRQGGNHLVQIIDAENGISSFTHDLRGNLLSSTDQLGRTTHFQWDLLDRLTKTTYPDGRFMEIEYSAAGNVAVRRDNLGRETQYSYDLADRLILVTRPDSTTLSYEYRPDGKKTAETDSLGRITRFEYSDLGLLTKTIYPDDCCETFSYNTEGQLIAKTNELGFTTSFEFDPMGRLIATIDPSGARWESQYDAAGRKISDKDPLNRFTTYQLDNLDRVTKVIRPDSSFTTNSFDAVGNLLSTVDALGNSWSWAYDNLNRPVKAIQPNGASSTTAFDAAGQVVAETDALNRTTRFSFDNGGRRTATTDALNNVWRNYYDSAGRLTAVQDPFGAVSSLTYDIMDRVISQSDALGNGNSFEFDNAGRRVAKTDAMGRRSITAYDLRDRPTSEVDPEGHTVSFGYNLAGQRVSLTDGANRVWRWEFDSLGRVTAEFAPLGNTNGYAFDSVGNRTSWTNARNQTTTYTFNSMNRLSQISYPDATLATMAYDLEGRELSRSGPSGTVTKTWDSVGNMTSETFGPWGKKWQYSFDLVGNRVQAIDPEGLVFKYRVDPLNRVVKLDPPDRGDEIKFAFDGAGRPITEERPGVKTTNTFDLAGRLLEMKHERDHSKEKIVASRKYTYSAVGNRLTMQDENNSITRYFYNGSDWLTKAVYPDGQTVSYGYNGAGDRTEEKIETPTVKGHGRHKVIGTDTVIIPMAYDAGGRLVSRASDTFVFDSDGNQVTAVENGDESRFFWSPDNRLVRVEKDIECHRHGKKRCHQCPQTQTFMVSESYAYLPNDWRRITRTADGQQLVSVFDGADESHEYLLKTRWDKDEDDERRRCPDRDRDKPRLKLLRQFIGGPGTDDLELTRYHGRKLWTLKDGIGSTIALTNRGGHPVARIGYDAFGNFKWPDKPGHGVKPCDDKDLPDWLDRLDLGRSFGFDFDGHHYGRHFARLLNPFTFQGRRFDGFSQTFNHRNRQYKPKYGRWLTKDPISFEGGLNLYNYVNNNPLVYTDPFGESIQAAIDMLKAHSDTVSWGQKLATAYATKNPTEIIKAFFSIQTELGKCAIDESNLNSIRFEIVTDELWTSPDVGYDQVWGLKFWSPADFGSSLNYALYHYIKHGKEVGAKDFSDYLDKTNSARLNVSGEPTRIDSPTFGEIYKYKLKNGKYITLTWDGQIVSYGNQ